MSTKGKSKKKTLLKKRITQKLVTTKTKNNFLRINRALKTLSKSNQTLIRSDNEIQFMQDVCRNIIETGGYRLAWIGFSENDENKSVRPVAQYGYEEGYLDSVNITWADQERGRGPTGTCIRTEQPVVSNNILNDPKLIPWRENAIKRDYASSVGLPLVPENGKIIGALTIYAKETDAFDKEELDLLMELAGDAAYGITMLRMKKEYDIAVTELKNNYEKLKEVDQLKSNFISIISHELRTPLTVIKGFTSFLIKESAGVLNDTQKNFVNTIDLNTTRLSRIINDMVDISKIERGIFVIEKESVDLIEILNEAVESMDYIANTCGVTIERDIKIESASIEADKGRLIQAISGILNNAIRFSKRNNKIKVELNYTVIEKLPEKIRTALSKKHAYYCLRVFDYGPGIEKKHIEKIFERFFQIENANVRIHQGVGLGLSIAKNIVETHAGFIWAESEGLGKGSTICMLLPK
jgi:signal transduction histidine kinase